ncbi:putative nuclease HARBI1 [Eriocheir sinensis]|uniref:putative nuclease HARBI1 n=1 Tax=Eriocheir sinensis TaxID=95602 RepID=UPI0021C91581|nr:putative nuclease HARBI1 [Eriocheir sinensis]
MLERSKWELQPQLERRTRRSQALPTHTQVLLALRFLASGSFQHVIGDTAGVTQASISRVLDRICTVLSDKSVQEIKMPPTNIERRRIARKFLRIQNFPRVIGAIDGTHVAIKAPSVDEALYFNRKRYHSLNIQLV